jgi:integrase
MSIYKRGAVYWYKFSWDGRLIRESTKQGNDRLARTMEAAHKTSLARGEVGLRDKKPLLTLAEFCKMRFQPWAESSATSPKTWRDFYRVQLVAILDYEPLAHLRLDSITSEHVAAFASHRHAQGLEVTSVNAALRVLRRVLRVAVEWGELATAPKIKMQPGERHRERVITPAEESKYLAAGDSLLSDVATILLDTGLRPEECYRLRWESLTWVNGRNGTLLVTHGKTKAARRLLPMTPRVRGVLEARWIQEKRPLDGWVWSAPTRSGHLEPSGLKKQHAKALRLSKVRPFVLYSLRHTFLTRLGASGCDTWTLARIAGHSSIAMSARYVHPSEDSVLDAMSRMGTLTGHTGDPRVGTKMGTVGRSRLPAGNRASAAIYLTGGE